MTSKPTISAVVLTLNEGQDLSMCLSSLLWCDDLIIVDSGSSDKTIEIASNFHCRVFTNIQQTPFDISRQRNWALDNCSIQSDWVLFLDADECIGAALRQTILSTISSHSPFNAYEMTPRYWFFGRWLRRTQGYPNWHGRLVRNRTVRFAGGVWEHFDSYQSVGRIYQPYEHYAFSKGIDSWLEKHTRYANAESLSICNLLDTGDTSSFSTRWKKLRIITARFWWSRPFLRFIQKYVFQLGFLEGWQGLLFSLMMAMYDLITIIKVIENRYYKTNRRI